METRDREADDLIEQADNLLNASYDSPKFKLWHDKVLDWLEQNFGKDSRQYKRFCELRFYHRPLTRKLSYEWSDEDEQQAFQKDMEYAIAYLKDYAQNLPQSAQSEQTNTGKDASVIFLSHSSADKSYGDALEELLRGIGIKKEQLIYTSHSLHAIPLNNNIYDYLRQNINKSVYVIFLLSDAYFASSACLNEMGAAWLAHKEYTSIFVPGFDFNTPVFTSCAIDTKQMGIILSGDQNCKVKMTEFKEKICSLFHLSIDEKDWIVLLDEFVNTITGLSKKKVDRGVSDVKLTQKQKDIIAFLSHIEEYRHDNSKIDNFIDEIGEFRFKQILPALKSMEILNASQDTGGRYYFTLMIGFSTYTEKVINDVIASVKNGEIVV